MSTYPDITGDAQAVVRFQQAYAEFAFLCYGIPVGQPIVVTVEQDKFLCDSAVEYLRDQAVAR